MAIVIMRALLLVNCLICCASKASAETFDYIIVGAGTSGLVVANRLSEDPSVTVAVIEAGADERNNTAITDPDGFTLAFNTPVDWAYKTMKQPGAGDRELDLHQGKAWGGTSTINGMTYIRGDKAQFDAWEELGNPGWTWEALLPYYLKSEKYTVPSSTQLAAGVTFEPQYHGFGAGPVHVGYPAALRNGSFAPTIIQTWEGLSLPHNPDLNSGDVRGYSMGPQTLDSELKLRWDSARAYYYPVELRPNLKIVRGTVRRITWARQKRRRSSCGEDLVVADGVEFLTESGAKGVLRARKEVIVSAGAVRTPLVLEGSGIGNPRILESLGIETKVDLPGVGENLLEQPSHIIAYSGALGPSPSAYHTFVTAADLFGDGVTAIEASTRANLSRWAQAAVDASGPGALNITAVEKLLRIQHDLIFKRNVTAAEFITVAAGELLASNYWILMPFSRGSVHLGSVEDINKPLIDARFFLADFDLTATVVTGKLAQKYWQSEPVSSFVAAPLIPGPDVLPDDATDTQWETYARMYLNSNAHAIGTASMMSKALGGVVDPELRVYGTSNVRVVDASILPMQMSGHLTATLYAVAERASDLIKRTAR